MRTVILGTTSISLILFRADLIKELINQGHQVFALAIDYNEESMRKIRELGATPISYSFSRSNLNILSDLKNTWLLYRQIKNISPQTVFAFQTKPIIFGTWAAKLGKVPTVVGMIEGLGYAFTPSRERFTFKRNMVRFGQILLYRLALPKLDHVFFLNQDDPIDLVEKFNIPVKSSSVLPGIGVNLQEFSYSPPPIEPIRFIFVGRLLKDKGVREFIDAALRLKKRYPQTEFIVLGGLDTDNPSGISLDEMSKFMDQGVIIYAGNVNNVDQWLKKSSVFVLPSYREGLPRSIQEAMAVGRPIITTNTPGCRETVIDEQNGFLVPPWQSAILATKMESFIINPDLIKNMGQRSRELAELRYDTTLINKQLIMTAIKSR